MTVVISHYAEGLVTLHICRSDWAVSEVILKGPYGAPAWWPWLRAHAAMEPMFGHKQPESDTSHGCGVVTR